MSVVLLGVPWNSSGTTDGVARAPAALRAAGLVDRCAAIATVRDGGDVPVDPPMAERGPDGVIDGANLARTLARVRATVAEIRRAGDTPVLVGGDCPILLGGLTGAADADPDGRIPGLLFVDGHEDAWPAAASTTGEAADMELGWLLGPGVDALADPLRATVPSLDPTRLALLGPRDRAELAEAGVRSVGDHVSLDDDAAVRADPSGATRVAMARISPVGAPWWLHVDLDVLSSEALPAVDYLQPGGLSWAELETVATTALAHPGCVGMTVTIYDPDLDPDGRHAARIVAFVATLAASV